MLDYLEKFANALEDNRIIFGENGKGRPQLKVFYNEVKFKGSVPDTWFDSHIFWYIYRRKKRIVKIVARKPKYF